MASDNKNTKRESTLRSNDKISKMDGSASKKTSTKSKDKEQAKLFDKTIIKRPRLIEEKPEYSFDVGSKFDPSLPIYIQIHANNIYRFFSSALISPQYGENENMFSDVQSVNSSVLILSNGFIARVEEKSVLLDVFLTEDELFELEITNGVAVFRRPLPISRIKEILVGNEQIKREILNTSLSADGGLIPECLFSFFKKNHEIFYLPEVKATLSVESPESKLFDKILGTFSFLSNYSILMANRMENVKTLPDHFFIAANAISTNYKLIDENERISNFYKILFKMNHENQPLLQWLVRRMFEGSNFTDSDVVAFAEVILKFSKKEFLTESKDILNSLMKSLERKNSIREIQHLKQPDKFYLYLFAILRQYGNINTEDKSISRADLPKLIHPAYGEYTFACLGYFYGYKAQRNFEEKISLNDKLFSEILETGKRLNIKFRLNTALDLSLIESVYQYAFNSKKDLEFFDYSKYPQITNELLKRPSYLSPQYNFDMSVFYGKAIYNISKKSEIDQIERLLQNIDIIPGISNFGARCYRKGLKVESITLRDIQVTEPKYAYFFRKVDILFAIQKGILKAEDVLKDIIFGLEEKEF